MFSARRVVVHDGEPASLYTIVNTIPPRSARGGKRSSYVCVYQQLGAEDESKWTLSKTRSASGKAITVFDVKWVIPPRCFRPGRKDGTDAIRNSAKGSLLAYGSSDLSIGVLDAKTLAVCSFHHRHCFGLRFLTNSLHSMQPVVSILNAHEFPATVLRFNPSGTLLMSGSADNSVRVMEVPAMVGSGGAMSSVILYVLLALLAILAAVVLRQ